MPHWDDATTKELILEGWELVSQGFINKKVLTMPQRLREVDERDGQMVGH
jgi:hypothetical protein